ncbi:MAG: sulfite exporter TauE/SafE family protein [Gemmatimonadales bacterium]
MTAAAILLASLLGSVHCAAMCGGIALAAGNGGSRSRAIYHLSRLLVYAGLGLLAGTGGALIQAAGRTIGLAGAAAAVAGWSLVAFGVVALLRALGVRLPGASGPIERAVRGLGGRIRAVPPRWRAAALGALTGLLPCGWLYAFVLVAASSGSPQHGALLMSAFWLGTVPWVLAGSLALRGLLGRSGPRLAAVVVIAVGLLTALGRVGPHASTHAPSALTSHAASSH